MKYLIMFIVYCNNRIFTLVIINKNYQTRKIDSNQTFNLSHKFIININGFRNKP